MSNDKRTIKYLVWFNNNECSNPLPEDVIDYIIYMTYVNQDKIISEFANCCGRKLCKNPRPNCQFKMFHECRKPSYDKDKFGDINYISVYQIEKWMSPYKDPHVYCSYPSNFIIPKSVCYLYKLTQLKLVCMDFAPGLILPEEIGRLTNLETIKLEPIRDLGYKYSIPKNIVKLKKNLKILHLQSFEVLEKNTLYLALELENLENLKLSRIESGDFSSPHDVHNLVSKKLNKLSNPKKIDVTSICFNNGDHIMIH